jgi:glutathione S-transferase
MTGPAPLILTTYDWVPDFARGHVRDIRVRWVLGEIGRPFQVETTPVYPKAAAHFGYQPFGQVPFVRDGDLVLFESGAILLHLARGTDLLPPGDDGARVLQWVIAGLNSVEPFAITWATAKFFTKDEASAEAAAKPLVERLGRLHTALGENAWLTAGRFTVADILMADILRIPHKNDLLADLPGLAAYVARATARPAFGKAHADQLAHFQAADAARAKAAS